MNYLFFDCETTGLPRNFRAKPSADDNWPRIVSLAFILASEGVEESMSYVIRPEGFTIPQEATDVHGITNERAHAEGKSLFEVLYTFYGSMDLLRDTTLVAHNYSFDAPVLGSEFLRKMDKNPLDGRESICTMKGSTSWCGLPGNKWPKLTELYEKCFDRPMEGAHDALTDVTACKDCFFHLQGLGVL